MSQPARKLAPTPLYDTIMALPVGVTGEIINGQLYTQPRPSGLHGFAESALNSRLFESFSGGRGGGPGGWWIIVEPEVHFVVDTELAVPDLAGWQRVRMPNIPRDHRFVVVPDWVCEIASPSTANKDRILKMPLYARYGVPYLWLVDPLAQALEAYQLAKGSYTVLGHWQGQDFVSIAPFDAIQINLSDLWC